MKNLKLTFVMLLFSIIVFSQTDSLREKGEKKIIIKWTPTALIGRYAAIQFAAEVPIMKKKSFQFEYGFMFPGINNNNVMRSKNVGHKIRFEQRNYFTQKEHLYIAPELHFLYANYVVAETFSQNWMIDSLTGEKYTFDYYFENVGVQKMAIGANCKVGYQYIFKKIGVVLDSYFGFGLRYVNTKFTSYPVIGEFVPPKDDFMDAPFSEGDAFYPNIIVGFKIGYQF